MRAPCTPPPRRQGPQGPNVLSACAPRCQRVAPTARPAQSARLVPSLRAAPPLSTAGGGWPCTGGPHRRWCLPNAAQEGAHQAGERPMDPHHEVLLVHQAEVDPAQQAAPADLASHAPDPRDRPFERCLLRAHCHALLQSASRRRGCTYAADPAAAMGRFVWNRVTIMA